MAVDVSPETDSAEVPVEPVSPPRRPVGRPPRTGTARTPLPPPRSTRATRTDSTPSTKPTEPNTATIADALGEILSLPAFAMAAPAIDCDFCKEHFIKQGPKTGRELAKLSEDHPALRGALVKVTIAWNSISLLGVVAEYVGRPVVHHGPGALQPFTAVVGVPKREEADSVMGLPKRRRTRGHVHAAGTEATAGTAQPAPASPSADTE